MDRIEKLSSLVLCILGIVLVVDAIFEQFFNIGIRQNSLTIGLLHCICITFYKISKYFKEKICNYSFVYNDSTNNLFFNFNISLR